MTVLASYRKNTFWWTIIYCIWQRLIQNNWCYFYKYRRNHIKTHSCFYVKRTQKFKYLFWICSTSIARRCNWDNSIFRSSLNMTELEWSKYDWTIKSIACVVPETLLSQTKWLGFFSDVFSTIFMYCDLNISTNTEVPEIVSLSHFKIISSPLMWPLFVRKDFVMFQKILFVTAPSLEIPLKCFLTLLLLRNKNLFLCILYFFHYPWWSFCKNLFLNLFLVSGAQPELLYDRRSFVEFGHFNKLYV